jgi:hypothetical protein
MTESSEAQQEIGGELPAAVDPPETQPKRPGIKELVHRYGFLALGIYLSTFVVALTLGMITFGLFLDPGSWQTEGADPPWLIAKFADLTGAESGGFWVVTTAAAWLVFVKGSQIPRIMLTAALTPVVAKKLGREPSEAEAVPEPAPVEAGSN